MKFSFTSVVDFRRLLQVILVLLTAGSTGFAQITVTNATFPTAGTTLRTAFASNPSIAQVVMTPPGLDQVWDLSGLLQGSVNTTVFKAASEGSQAGNVPGAELVSTSTASPGGEIYYNVTSNKFEKQAVYDKFYDVVPLYLAQNIPPITERQAPLNFFDIWQSSTGILGGPCTTTGTLPDGSPFVECAFLPSDFPSTLMAQLSTFTTSTGPVISLANIEKLRYVVSIQRTEAVDAYGTMIIPGGSFPVLRTKRTEYREVRMEAKLPQDLIWQDITNQAIQSGFQGLGICTTYVYHFINDVEKEPIAIISTTPECCGGVEDCNGSPISTVEYKLVAPQLSINNVTLSEGNSGTTNFNFTVSLSAPAPAGGVSFDIATQDGTTNPATQPSDYTARSLTSQTIPAGSSTYNFTVAVNGDVDVEPDEIFFVNVSNVTGAILADGQGLGTITNDDVAPVLTSVTVTTSPVGRSIIVDGNTYTAPQTFNWTPGSNHTIATTSPQSGTTGTRYVFSNWSDGGAISHTITAPTVATTYTANFTTQYQLTTSASPSNGGTVNGTPASADNYYDAGSEVSISATANAGFSFANFSGDLTGTTSPQSVTMNAPRSVTANFSAETGITITSSPAGRTIIVDGSAYTAPQTFNWTPGSNHTIATTSPQSGTTGTRYEFNSWSDGGAISHTITAPSTATTYTASFTTQYQLTTSADAGGSILPLSGTYYNAGTVVPVTAAADAGFTFAGFSGDLTGVTNPQSLTMDGPKSVTAQFTVIPPPAASLSLTATGPSGAICGENLSITIKVKDFKDIGTLDFSVNWDPTELELISYTPLTIDDDAPLNGEFFANGELTYTWFDSDIDYGASLADGTTILTLNFKALVNSATGVTVDITGTPTAINASDLNFEEVTVTPENLVSFDINRVIVSEPTVTQPSCTLTTGTIVVNATGNGNLEYSIDGGTNWSPTNTFIGLAPGNYTIAVRAQSNPTCVVNYGSNPVVLTAATGCDVVCPKLQGYWKNNPSVWPSSALPMMLGTSRTYTKQQLLKIMKTSIGSGTKADASLILAHQLIAAKLNIAAGAIAPSSVTSAIAAADAAIGGSLIPMKVRTNTTLGKTMTSLAKTLESFNAGQLNAGCAILLTTSEITAEASVDVQAGKLELGQNYPNPFNQFTTIRYSVPVESTVSLAVYNSQGQLMAKLVDGRTKAGTHQVTFEASKLAAGIYLYRLQTTDAEGKVIVINKRMIISK